MPTVHSAAENPYLITSAADFKQLSEDVNGGNNYSGKYFKIPDTVTEIISLSTNDGYVPIGNNTKGFKGTFDGTADKLNKVSLYVAEYDNEGQFANIEVGSKKGLCSRTNLYKSNSSSDS